MILASEKTKPYVIIGDASEIPDEEWREFTDTAGYTRDYCISGSQIAAVIGYSKWRTPRDLWLEKTSGYKEEVTADKQKIFDRGHMLEEYVAHWYAEKTGVKVWNDTSIFQSVAQPWAVANIDRLVKYDDGTIGVLEIKTTEPSCKKDWLDGVPIYYEIQVRHYMMVLGLKKATIAVMWGFNPDTDLKYYDIDYDEKSENLIIEMGNAFIEACEKKVEPSNGFSSPSLLVESLVNQYSTSEPNSIFLPDDLETTVEKYVDVSKRITDIKDELAVLQKKSDALAIQVMEAMKTNEAAQIVIDKNDEPIEVSFTWKSSTRTTVDSQRLKKEQPDVYAAYTKTSTSRSFKLKSVKKVS